MKKIKRKINFSDNRGFIIDLLEKKNINAITFITQKKCKIRGNHFHKKTIQWNYLIKGKLELLTRKNKQKIIRTLIKEGELVETSKNESHAIKALKNSEFLVFTQGPRGGKEYENDTFRLKNPILK